VRVLSDQQIADLRAGRGMGLALPAELNGYPSPVHVLELGDQLKLTKDQRARVQEFHASIIDVCGGDLCAVELKEFNLSEIHPIWGVRTPILDLIFPVA
jgi:hypothetical protein